MDEEVQQIVGQHHFLRHTRLAGRNQMGTESRYLLDRLFQDSIKDLILVRLEEFSLPVFFPRYRPQVPSAVILPALQVTWLFS